MGNENKEKRVCKSRKLRMVLTRPRNKEIAHSAWGSGCLGEVDRGGFGLLV